MQLQPDAIARSLALMLAVGLTAGCSGRVEAGPQPDSTAQFAQSEGAQTDARRTPLAVPESAFPPAPPSPDGPLPEALARALETAFSDGLLNDAWSSERRAALNTIAASGDPRVAWVLSDAIRVLRDPVALTRVAAAAEALTGLSLDLFDPWGPLTDHLIAWDLPAPPGYLPLKRGIYTQVFPAWAPLFTAGEIDWRHVSWGGVPVDARPFGTTDDPCNCIPAADNPTVVPAAGATWPADDAVVFGVVVGDEARAYPRQIMEVREMVNDTLGGRSIGMPYCTLCAAAQVYFTDRMPDGVKRPTLRTSGLLIRSNKVMFDLETYSIFDTFRGHAVTGPLAARSIALQQASVTTTTWGQWKAAHPETTVLDRSLALGRDFDFRNGRDANGPIFPIGDVDSRLPVQAEVLGVLAQNGTPVAFAVEAAHAALARGELVALEGVRVTAAAGGLRATDSGGAELPAHQAFWFAWSQFHEATRLWSE